MFVCAIKTYLFARIHGLALLDKGLDTFLKVAERAPHLPVVVLTAQDDAAVAIETVRKGAQEYLVKGELEMKLLARMLRYAIDRKRTEELLKEKAAIESMNRFMIGREQRIIELKREVNSLLRELGRSEKYQL